MVRLRFFVLSPAVWFVFVNLIAVPDAEAATPVCVVNWLISAANDVALSAFVDVVLPIDPDIVTPFKTILTVCAAPGTPVATAPVESPAVVALSITVFSKETHIPWPFWRLYAFPFALNSAPKSSDTWNLVVTVESTLGSPAALVESTVVVALSLSSW